MESLLTISPLAYLAAFVVLLILTIIYMFWDEQQLRITLRDIHPDKRVEFLLRRFRHRGIAFLSMLTLIFVTLGYAVEDSRSKVKLIEKTAVVNNSLDKLQISELNKQAEAAHAAAQANAPDPEPSVVLDLFASDAELASEQSLDSIKKRYENALTGAYVLSHCNRTDKDELTILLSALRDDIIEYQSKTGDSDLNPQELYKHIVSAAEGSFQMIYGKTPCDSPQVDALQQQFVSFIMRYHANHAKINKN